ncbi:MAG: hypothetical protein AB1640_22490 [bacterium]
MRNPIAVALCGALLASMVPLAAGAGQIASPDHPALDGATVVDFEDQTPGSFYSGAVWDVAEGVDFYFWHGGSLGMAEFNNDLSGQYNMTGVYFDNIGIGIRTLRIWFDRPVSAFGFNLGGTHADWTLMAYGCCTCCGPQESWTLPHTEDGNAGDFFGFESGGRPLRYVELICGSDDQLYLDNLTFKPFSYADYEITHLLVNNSVSHPLSQDEIVRLQIGDVIQFVGQAEPDETFYIWVEEPFNVNLRRPGGFDWNMQEVTTDEEGRFYYPATYAEAEGYALAEKANHMFFFDGGQRFGVTNRDYAAEANAFVSPVDLKIVDLADPVPMNEVPYDEDLQYYMQHYQDANNGDDQFDWTYYMQAVWAGYISRGYEKMSGMAKEHFLQSFEEGSLAHDLVSYGNQTILCATGIANSECAGGLTTPTAAASCMRLGMRLAEAVPPETIDAYEAAGDLTAEAADLWKSKPYAVYGIVSFSVREPTLMFGRFNTIPEYLSYIFQDPEAAIANGSFVDGVKETSANGTEYIYSRWDCMLADEIRIVVVPTEAPIPLTGYLPDPGAYGKIREGDQSHVNEVKYTSEGLPGDVTVRYQVWDVDFNDEIRVFLNGEPVAYAARTANETWSETRYLVLADAAVLDSGTNVLTFKNTHNPPNTFLWGVRTVGLYHDCAGCLPLPDGAARGMIKGVDVTHPNEVDYSFEGLAGDVTIEYEVYDIDFNAEVEILVNGIRVGYAARTADLSWSGARTIVLPDAAVLDSGTNVLTFDNTYNPPRIFVWGVRGVSVRICPECIELSEADDAYGRITGGDQTHVDKVEYSFEGQPGDATVEYEVWDVDFNDEVEILVNGSHFAYAAKTASETWSGARTIVLPDAAVLDSGTNVLTFDNTYNPPKTFVWGVRNVSVDQCPDCIALPASGAYGRIAGGDQGHVNEVKYKFEGVRGNVSLKFEVWDVDFNDEVEILINGSHAAYAAKTANDSWGATCTLALPDAAVVDSGTNVLTFDNTYNPPKTFVWGVRNMSVSSP